MQRRSLSRPILVHVRYRCSCVLCDMLVLSPRAVQFTAARACAASTPSSQNQEEKGKVERARFTTVQYVTLIAPWHPCSADTNSWSQTNTQSFSTESLDANFYPSIVGALANVVYIGTCGDSSAPLPAHTSRIAPLRRASLRRPAALAYAVSQISIARGPIDWKVCRVDEEQGWGKATVPPC